MDIRVPKNSLVILIGPSGSGKSTAARKLFPSESIVSSDICRRLLVGDPTAPNSEIQKVSEGAFLMFYAWIRARLRHNQLTVADSTALRREYRDKLAEIAREEHCPVLYLFFDTPFQTSLERNKNRPGHEGVPELVVKKQFSLVNKDRGWLRKADNVYTIKPEDEVNIVFTEPDFGIKAEAIDVIGDVHGCLSELTQLIEKLGYQLDPATDRHYVHPQGRRLVFVGDLIDRGPEPFKTLEFVRQHVQNGAAYLVLSNHERKLRKFLSGQHITIKPEFQKSLDSIPADFDRSKIKQFLYKLKPYLLWTSPTDKKQWAIVHAAFKPEFIGKLDMSIEEYCVYGPVNSVSPEGIPDRIAWWETYRGPNVVYGHICTDDGKPRVVNGTYGIDTACVHGGELTALRLPEQEFVSVKAAKVYHGRIEHPEAQKDIPRPPSFLEKPVVHVTGLEGRSQEIWIKGGLWEAINQITTRTVSPEKLLWLAPTMSPGPVSEDPRFMEDPITTAKWMFKNAPEGTKLVAQLKHMGSRGTWLYEKTSRGPEITCWTRNGFDMFIDPAVRAKVYAQMVEPLGKLAETYNTDRLLVDGEVMPWNQHGDDWLERTFMTTAGAAYVSREAIRLACERAGHKELAEQFAQKVVQAKQFSEAATRFCWPVKDWRKDLQVGLFRVLNAGRNETHSEQAAKLNQVAQNYPFMRMTENFVFENTEKSLDNLASCWDFWVEEGGAEGIVLKYNDPNVWSSTKWPQQQLKVRGQDYLRIVYGGSYLETDILAALRKDRREDTKMRMAFQQSLLGNEALNRLERKEPWERIHECVVAILAGDRATVDPRL